MGLTDTFHRPINYMRISLTDRCNLRCRYCMPAGGIQDVGHEQILSYEEILRLVRVGVGLGITKIRLTGGEPLIRKGVVDFITQLGAIDGIEDLSLTTNGILLPDKIAGLKAAGVRRLNISLDTLDRDRYRDLTGSDGFDRVWEGIHKALELGFDPVKINMVVMKSVNDDEVSEMAALTLSRPIHMRFIEYMPIGCSRGFADIDTVPSEEILVRLQSMGRWEPVARNGHDGPARRYRLDGAPGEIGFISAMTQHFCATCNRIRLTASGRLRPCLLSDAEADVRGPLRGGASDTDLENIFKNVALKKQKQHQVSREHPNAVTSWMVAIGG